MTQILIKQGSDSGVKFPVTDLNGDPFNLTGYTGKAQFKSLDGSTVLHDFSTALGNLTFGTGEVVLTWTAAQSSAWKWTTGVYAVEITSSGGSVARVAQDFVILSKEVLLA